MSFMVLLVIVPGILLNIWMTQKEKARRRQRGFEVKQNTGPTPALREKENDHG